MVCNDFAALCIAGTRSGAGKTTISLGLMSCLREMGMIVQPFKVGPDYIDTAYHSRICGRASRNLDLWMMGENGVRESFASAVRGANIAVIEGVMGLYDGEADGSTAHLARILDIPLILVVDASSAGRSIAAVVKGFVTFEENLRFSGVIANNVGSNRHAEIISDALNFPGFPPLLGCLQRNKALEIKERHLGLVSDKEMKPGSQWSKELGAYIRRSIDVEKLTSSCRTSRMISPSTAYRNPQTARLGIALDDAFHFYYQDNLDMLENVGAKLIPFSPMYDKSIPDELDGIYLGGGFPEIFAGTLSQNKQFMESLRAFAFKGGLIYGECGGFMYLCRSMTDMNGRIYKMMGLLEADAVMRRNLAGLGYIEARTIKGHPFGESGTLYRGHEFHYSQLNGDTSSNPFCEARKGAKGEWRADGMRKGNVFGTYIHTHFASNPTIPINFVRYLKTLENLSS